MSAINESLIRDVVSEVLGRLGGAPAPKSSAPAPTPAQPSCSCNGQAHSSASPGLRGKFGVFQDANEACAAAHEAFLQLQQKGVAARRKIEEIVKTFADKNSAAWGRLELEETKIGRLDHKIEKLQIIKLVPGVEWLVPYALSGDHGITLEEYTPFGVVGAVTPSTHSIPTLSGNIVNIVAAGNAVVFNAHPAAARCAATAVRAYNHAIERETGIENLVCIIESPSLDSFKAICAHPGNPPVLVDDTACLERAARCVINGAAYDNNLLCIGEKEVFALDNIAEAFMAEMEKQGAVRLNAGQLERLTREAFTFKEGQGAGCAEPVVNRNLIGKDATVLAKAAGANVPDKTQLLFAETDRDHLFVKEEQMMPILPIVRVRSVEEGIQAAKTAERNYKHTAVIHSHDVEHMTAMARALDTTLFIKNGPCMAGLGLGGEGYLSYSIATPTGEGVTNPKTFTRVRRCVMVDNLRIY